MIIKSEAGNNDSPGPPAQGSGMYSLRNIYDYLLTGSPLTVQSGFQMPAAAPAPTMKTLHGIGTDIKASLDQCDAAIGDVTAGKKFFCTLTGRWGVQTGSASIGAGNLLKTGQTIVYRAGDDGTYQKGVPFGYTDNGDGTVTDNVTGLMWAGDGIGSGCANGATMTWYQAIDWAENLTFAGYSDWRLPNATELQSIVNYENYAPSLNTTFFPNTNFSIYWASTTRSWRTSYAHITRFDTGTSNNTRKFYAYYVRSIRGGR